jgi:DHA3 family macrolide efflux protein-like MFS transporter
MSSILFNLSIPITYGGIGALADVIGADVCYSLGGVLLIICMIVGFLNTKLRDSGLILQVL